MRDFYRMMREKKYREAFAMSIYRPAIEGLSAEEYKRLKSFDDRRVARPWELPDELLEELEKAEPPEWTSELDHLMEP